MSIKQMAEAVSREINNVGVYVDNSEALKKIYPNRTKLKLDTTKIRGLGWKPAINLKESINKFKDNGRSIC